jgi:hypothetical protein
MSDRFDVISFRKSKNGKVYAVRLGSASPRDDAGFNCWLDAIPAPGPSGSYEIQIVPQRDRAKGGQSAPQGEDMNDSIIPF